MATYHCSVKVGGKGKAAAHASYISREGKYSGRERYEDLESTAYGNMPKWAEHNPAHFWWAADEHERANGATYREIQVALPRELTPDQRRALVEDFVAQEIGDKHAYQWAIHTPKAALEGGEQPHAHVMYSERTRDDLDRDPSQYFRRYNAKAPERGGCRKDSAGTEERLQATRERWADVQNAHLERHGHDVRVDHRSLEAQGIDRQPEKHIGGRGVRQLQEADISALLERRAAEGELERAQRQVSSAIDLSGDLATAKADRKPAAPSQDELRAGLEAARAQFEAHKLAEADKALKIAPSAFAGLSVAELAAEVEQTRRRLESTDELARRDPDVSRLAQHWHGLAEQHWQALAEAERHRREAEAFRAAHGVQAWLHGRGLGHSVKLLAMEQAQEAAQAKVEQIAPAQAKAEQAHEQAYTAAVWRIRAERRPDVERLTALNEALRAEGERAEIARQEQARRQAEADRQARPAPSRRPTNRPAAERDDDLSM